MLRVTIEIVPFGVEAEKRTISTIEVANIGKTAGRGNYGYHDYACRRINGDGIVTAMAYVYRHDRAWGADWLINAAIVALETSGC